MNSKTKSHNVWIIVVTIVLTAIVNWLGVKITDEQLSSIASTVGPAIPVIGVALWNLFFTEGGVKDGKTPSP